MLIGYREALALRLAAKDGYIYVSGYGPVFEAAMVCEKIGLLEPGYRADDLTLTPKGLQVLSQIPAGVEDGWTLEVA